MFENCSISSVVVGKGAGDLTPLYEKLMDQQHLPFYKISVDKLKDKINIPTPEGMPPPEYLVFHIRYPQNAFLV